MVTDYAANPVVTHDQVLSSDDPNLTIMSTVGDTGTGSHLKTLDKNAAAFIYGPAIKGKPDVVTTATSAVYSPVQNPAVASLSWDPTTQTLTHTGRSTDDTILRLVGQRHHQWRRRQRPPCSGSTATTPLNGGAGNDLLAGGPGADTMIGGTGHDTYYVDNVGDVVTERANQGYDTVISSVSNTLPANVEQLQLLGAGLTGKGNNSANTIFGDGTSSNTLYGLGGDDYIVAGSGNDNDPRRRWQRHDLRRRRQRRAHRRRRRRFAGRRRRQGQARPLEPARTDLVYQALSDSLVGAGRDIITDFTPGTDVIDVSRHRRQYQGRRPAGLHVYRRSRLSDTKPGSFNTSYVGNSTIVTGDVDGNGTADFQIQLSGHLTLTASDFDLGGDSPSNASTNQHQLTSAIAAAFDSGLLATPAPPSSSSGTSSNPVNLAISPV